MTHLILKKFKGDVYLTSTLKPEVKVIELDFDPTFESDDDSQNEKTITINRFESVKNVELHLVCRSCKRKIQINTAKKIVKCGKCGLHTRSAD